MVSMTTATHTRAPVKLKPAAISEWQCLLESAGSPPLKIDKEKGIIYDVRICGPRSPNNHGIRGVTEGTEYTRQALESELPMLNGRKVKIDHPPREAPNIERSVYETFGVIRDPRICNESEGPVIRGNLHYIKSHPLAARVIEDVESGLGVFGLSHNAKWKDGYVRNGRLVVTLMDSVESVDLVDKPATNKNLAESREPTMKKHSLKSILEGRQAKFSAPRIAWSRRLLEMDGMPIDAEAELPAEPETDPEAALKAGFRAAVNAVLDDESLDLGAKLKKLKELLTTEEKLLSKDEPAEPAKESDEEGDGKGKDKDKETKESVQAENVKLKRELAVRQLCAKESFTPTDTQLKTLCLLESDAERKSIIGDFKAVSKTPAGSPGSRPRSGPAGGNRTVTESKDNNGNPLPQGVGGALAILRRS